MSLTVDRYHTLATAYQGFYPSEEDELKKVSYTAVDSKADPKDKKLPAFVQQDLIGEIPPTPQQLQQPPYRPVMRYESKRTPLGSMSQPNGQQTTAFQQQQYKHRCHNEIVLSELEFAILCALAGVGLVMLIMPNRFRSDAK